MRGGWHLDHAAQWQHLPLGQLLAPRIERINAAFKKGTQFEMPVASVGYPNLGVPADLEVATGPTEPVLIAPPD